MPVEDEDRIFDSIVCQITEMDEGIGEDYDAMMVLIEYKEVTYVHGKPGRGR